VGLLASATKARDINGFELGMHLREARKLAPVQLVGGSQFEATKDGISYNFEVTPAGRLYRISSTQLLGRFQVDAPFLQTLRAKLTVKYGPPQPGRTDPFSWSLIQPIRQMNGSLLPFTTNWFSVQTSGNGTDGVELSMTMIDFRLLWADQQAANRLPRSKAENSVRF